MQNFEGNDMHPMLDPSYQKYRNINTIEEDDDMLFLTPTVDNNTTLQMSNQNNIFNNSDQKLRNSNY